MWSVAVAVYLTKDTFISQVISYTRSYIKFGGPLMNFTSLADRKALQNEEFLNRVEGLEDNFINFFGMSGSIFSSYYHTDAHTANLNVEFICRAFREAEFSRLVKGDLSFLGGSVLFVFIFLCLHLGSFFLASTGIVMILCSLYVGLFIYWYIFQIKYYSSMHVLTFFLVLGIGADDIFVFVDGWKQTVGHGKTLSEQVG